MEYPLLCFGWRDGSIEMLELNRNGQPSTVEGYFGVEQHAGPVKCIDFHDGLQVFLSTGGDRVLRFWDNAGFTIQKITLQKEAVSASFVQATGAVIVSQDQNILEIPFEKWMPPELLGPLKKAGLDGYPFLAHHKTGYIEERRKAKEAERKRRISLQSETTRTMNVGPLVFKFPGSSQPRSPRKEEGSWRDDISFPSSPTKEGITVDMEKLKVALKQVHDPQKQSSRKGSSQWSQLPSRDSSVSFSQKNSARNSGRNSRFPSPPARAESGLSTPSFLSNDDSHDKQEKPATEQHPESDTRVLITFNHNRDKEKINTAILDTLSSKAVDDVRPPTTRRRTQTLTPSRPTSSRPRPGSGKGRKLLLKKESSCSSGGRPDSHLSSPIKKEVSFEAMSIQGSKKHLHLSEGRKGLAAESPFFTEVDDLKDDELRIGAPTHEDSLSKPQRAISPFRQMFGSFAPAHQSPHSRKSTPFRPTRPEQEREGELGVPSREENTVLPDIFVDAHQKKDPVVAEVYQVPETEDTLTDDEMIKKVPGQRLSLMTPEGERQQRVKIPQNSLSGSFTPLKIDTSELPGTGRPPSGKKQVRFVQQASSMDVDRSSLSEWRSESKEIELQLKAEHMHNSLTNFAMSPKNFNFKSSSLEPPAPASLKATPEVKTRKKEKPPSPPRNVARNNEAPLSSQIIDSFSIVNFSENPALLEFFDKMEEEQALQNLQKQSFRPSPNTKPNIFRNRELRLKKQKKNLKNKRRSK